MKVFEYMGELVNVMKFKYGNKRLALELRDLEGQPYARITLNDPSIALAEDEIIVKSYSENEGILEWLKEHNMVSDPIKWIACGFIKCPIVELYDERFWTRAKNI